MTRLNCVRILVNYVVVQAGLTSISGVFGPFETFEDAVAHANAFVDDPRDDAYHNYDVCELTPRGLGKRLYRASRPDRARSHVRADQAARTQEYEPWD